VNSLNTMRFYNILAILALGGASAQVADDEGARNLRGPEPGDEVEVEGRDLLVTASSSSYSKSTKVTLHKCWKGDGCVDIYENCFAIAFSEAMTYTKGSLSVAEAHFVADACCMAMAEANACSFACVEAKGKIDLNARADTSTRFGTNMIFDLKASIESAVLTYAKAESAAAAAAIVEVGGGAYTLSDADYCNGPGKGSYKCDPTKAEALAAAEAEAYGDASALAGAGSGAFTWVGGCIQAYGSSIDKIAGLFTSCAKSFSWAEAYTQAVAGAYAVAFADAVAISKHCGKSYDDYCGCPTCGGKCPKWASKEDACSYAKAEASAFALACADACAAASADASASALVALSFGGTLTNCKNDGKPLGIAWADGKMNGEVGCAMVCPSH
jgi:hypothetical protein